MHTPLSKRQKKRAVLVNSDECRIYLEVLLQKGLDRIPYLVTKAKFLLKGYFPR